MVVLLVVIVRVGMFMVVMVVVVMVVVVLSARAKRPATAKTLWPLRVNGERFVIEFQGGGGNAQGCFIHGGPMRYVNFALLEFPGNQHGLRFDRRLQRIIHPKETSYRGVVGELATEIR